MEKDEVLIDFYNDTDTVTVYLFDKEEREILEELGTYSIIMANSLFDVLGEIRNGKIILEDEEEEEDYSEFSLVDEDD
jgi:hypothetical protein